MSKKKKTRSKAYRPRPVHANDLFLEFSPAVSEKALKSLATLRAVAFKELTSGRGTLERVAELQSAIECAWGLAAFFENKEEICLLLLCATAELQTMRKIIDLGYPQEIKPWMTDALVHALDVIDDQDYAVTKAEYLRSLRYMAEHHTKVLTVGGARQAACVDPTERESWEKFLDYTILAYLHGRPVRGFFIERKGTLYFCATDQGPDTDASGRRDDVLIRIEGPHIIAVCDRMSPETLADENTAREREK